LRFGILPAETRTATAKLGSTIVSRGVPDD